MDEGMTQPVISEERGAYRINLPTFEGPFDLLLHLIRKHDLDIHDIPIAGLTTQYLAYLDTMQTLNIDLAGEFLVMAAELMHIKSQWLLPQAPALEEEQADPRADLVRRLLEYQRFKDAAAQLSSREMLLREVFVPLHQAPDLAAVEDAPAPIDGGSVYQLIEAFDRILQRMPLERFHTVAVDRVSVNQRIYELAARLQLDRTVELESLVPVPCARYDIVVTFLALLEMARLRMISLFQTAAEATLFVTALMELQPEELGELVATAETPDERALL